MAMEAIVSDFSQRNTGSLIYVAAGFLSLQVANYFAKPSRLYEIRRLLADKFVRRYRVDIVNIQG